jgi:hypothetical protein
MDAEVAAGEAVSLYIDLKQNERVDLEVAARAAIEWAKTLKAASIAADPNFNYRVILIAAEPGSSKWLAMIEQSPVNQALKDVSAGWQQLPELVRYTVAAAAFVTFTAYPTYVTYFYDAEFSATQLDQLEVLLDKVSSDPEVRTHRKAMYRELQKDNNITGVGGGVPDNPDWRPPEMIPARRFPEGDGLFEMEEPINEGRRTIYKELDVILVTPRLVNKIYRGHFAKRGYQGNSTQR